MTGHIGSSGKIAAAALGGAGADSETGPSSGTDSRAGVRSGTDLRTGVGSEMTLRLEWVPPPQLVLQ